MFSHFSDLTYQIHASLRDEGFDVSRSHVRELLSAFLGHGSYAALQASQEWKSGFKGVAYVIADQETATHRLDLLSPDYGQDVLEQALEAFGTAAEGRWKIFGSEADFVEEFVVPEIDSSIVDEDAVCSAMATTNAYVGSTYIDHDEPRPLKDCDDDEWSMTITGQVDMDQDEDKVFYGDKVLFTVEIAYPRLGKACLGERTEYNVSAEVEDYWGEDDSEPASTRPVADEAEAEASANGWPDWGVAATPNDEDF